MSSDKKTIVDFPEAIDEKDLSSEGNECAQRRSRKKRLIIISITILTILVCIAVAILVVFSYWVTRVRLQEKEHLTVGNKEVEQEFYADDYDSLTIYNITDGTTEAIYILDINREIIIMKLTAGEYKHTVCYVEPFDPSTISVQRNSPVSTTTTTTKTGAAKATTPSSDSNGAAPSNQSLPTVTLRTSNRPIKEKSILGKRGQELCKDINTFWILSSSSTLGGNTRGSDVRDPRVRRQQSAGTVCRYDWNRCHYMTFSDQPYNTYYTCDWTCY